MNKIDTACEHLKLRLIAAAVGLQQCERAAANIIPLPGGDRVIAIGTRLDVARLLEIAPAGGSIDVLDTLDAVTGKDIAGIACFETERFYLAGDVDGLVIRAARHIGQQAALQQIADLGQEREADERTALVNALKAIRPTFGAVGSRDVEVAAQQKLFDRAITLLSPPAQPAAASAAASDLMAVDCPACEKDAACDECSGQGKIIVSRADMAALADQHDHSEGGHHD